MTESPEPFLPGDQPMADLAAMPRPCGRCPFRQDTAAYMRYPNLASYAAGTVPDAEGLGPDWGADMFACHTTPADAAQLCAGWLAVEGGHHPTVRFAVVLGVLPPEALTAGANWPELFETATEMIEAVGGAIPAGFEACELPARRRRAIAPDSG